MDFLGNQMRMNFPGNQSILHLKDSTKLIRKMRPPIIAKVAFLSLWKMRPPIIAKVAFVSPRGIRNECGKCVHQ